MSLDINWGAFLKEFLNPDICCKTFTSKINEKIPENSPISNIRITQFDLNSCGSPNIEVKDLTDIRDEFLVAAGLCRNIQSPPPSEISLDHNISSLIDATSLLYSRPAETLKDAILQDGMETTLQFDFNDDSIRIEFEADAVLNVPVSGFLSLPLKFTLTRFQISGQSILAFPSSLDRLLLSFPAPLKEFDFQLSVDVGDSEKHVLRNVAKIERFLFEQIKILINDRMVMPQFIEIPFKENN